jgi:hypothetical protein
MYKIIFIDAGARHASEMTGYVYKDGTEPEDEGEEFHFLGEFDDAVKLRDEMRGLFDHGEFPIKYHIVREA